ncbi:hypothetical protein VTN96DRAFT_3800 [Rasamsonia emersonii]
MTETTSPTPPKPKSPMSPTAPPPATAAAAPEASDSQPSTSSPRDQPEPETQNDSAAPSTSAPPNPLPVDLPPPPPELGDDDDPWGEFGVDDDNRSASSASITSSITRYRWENGRRYHAYKDGAYWGPNDEKAANHLDIAHHLFLLTLKNKLHLAPIGDNPQRVLDIGTGTGIWAIDFADQYPSAQVIGTDLSPIQPSWVPPNLKFEIDDAEDDWMYQKNSFDFIHVRSLFGCIADWPRFYRQVLRHLKPGGYFEQVEMAPGFKSDDGSLDPNTPYGYWHDLGVEVGRKMGKSFETMYEMKGFITEAGFEDIHETTYKWPIGPWMESREDKEIGMWARFHIEEGLENWAMAPLTRVMGWKKEEVEITIMYVKQDLKRKDIHGYHEMRVIYGRKPMNWREPRD